MQNSLLALQTAKFIAMCCPTYLHTSKKRPMQFSTKSLTENKETIIAILCLILFSLCLNLPSWFSLFVHLCEVQFFWMNLSLCTCGIYEVDETAPDVWGNLEPWWDTVGIGTSRQTMAEIIIIKYNLVLNYYYYYQITLVRYCRYWNVTPDNGWNHKVSVLLNSI